MVGRTVLVCIGFMVVALSQTSGALAQSSKPVLSERFGAFFAVEGNGRALVLNADIEESSPLEFLRALKARPETNLLYLDSVGGSVNGALLIAHEVRERGIATVVPEDAVCYSACAFIFFAGSERAAVGQLGVHQIWNDANDLVSGQAALSDVVDALSDFGVHTAVLSTMMRTPPNQMHVFGDEELIRYNLETGDPLGLQTPPSPKPPVVAEAPAQDHGRDLGPENVTTLPMTTTPGTGDGRRERIISVRDTGSLADTLLKNGFTEREVQMVLATLRNVRPSANVQKGARLRILFGPARNADILIPYRISIYDPDPHTGTPKHTATAALTDRGNYVIGLEPAEIVFDGENTSPNRQPSTGPRVPGRDDRLLPEASTPERTSTASSLLLEASDSGKTGAIPFSGTIRWIQDMDEAGRPTLVGKAHVPARGMDVEVLIRNNSNLALPASHLIEVTFRLADGFVGGSVAGMPGVLLKNEELVQGSPLVGASARIVANQFLFALSASPDDLANNARLLADRKWIDLALIYATGTRAIITLEKTPAAETLFKTMFSNWHGPATVQLQPGFNLNLP